jgi:hypothetical protein
LRDIPTFAGALRQQDKNMPKNLSLPELIGRLAEINSRPSDELVEQFVIKVLEEHRDCPVEVQARAVIDAIQEVDAWRLDAPTEAGLWRR